MRSRETIEGEIEEGASVSVLDSLAFWQLTSKAASVSGITGVIRIGPPDTKGLARLGGRGFFVAS